MDNIWKFVQQNRSYNDHGDSNKDLNEITEDFSKKITFPLATVDDIKNFDTELKNNTEFKKFIFKEYSKIGGTDGRQKGDKVSATLAEVFFTKNVLINFSWTGISRTPGIEKKPFQCYEALIDAFYSLIRLSDSRWSKEDNVSFFRDKILKHANSRVKAQNLKTNKKLKNLEAANIPSDDPTTDQATNNATNVPNEIIVGNPVVETTSGVAEN